MRSWLALLSLLVSTPVWADCPLDLGHGTGIVFFSDRYMIAMRPDPIRIEVGLPFALLMNVCTKGGDAAELVAVEATMPEHKQGMNDATKIHNSGSGRYRVEGMLFDMPGNWEVAFDVRPEGQAGGEIQRLTHDFVVK
jgi:YtkA-like